MSDQAGNSQNAGENDTRSARSVRSGTNSSEIESSKNANAKSSQSQTAKLETQETRQLQEELAESSDEGEINPEDLGMSMKKYPRNKWRFACGVMYMVITGMSDAAPGAVLPNMEIYYNITYTIVSMIWLSTAVGFIVVAFLSQKLEQKLGARQLVLGSALLCVMYAMTTPAPPFAVVVVGFFFGGMGMAMILSYFNIVVGRMQNSSMYMGIIYGSYGIGACVGPMIATIMMNNGIKWSIIYGIMLGLCVLNTVALALAFRGYARDVADWELSKPTVASAQKEPESAQKSATEGGNEVTAESADNVTDGAIADSETRPFLMAAKAKITWLVAFFIFFYQGAEISTSGWVITFLEVYRHGSTRTTGYVSSGFWIGMTLGRMILTPLVNRTVGPKRGITMLALCGLACCILAWRLSNFVAESVFVGLMGIFTGPMYPMMIIVAVRVIPKSFQIIALTIVTAVGSSGGAIFPLMVGITSQHVGTQVVLPFIFAMLGTTLVIWAFIPNPDRPDAHNILQRLW